jgi:BlaI family transcriptional regulator, penicillinase repressor
MARKTDVRLTRLELEIMDLLWSGGEASIREILERIPEKKRPAYTTVQTIVQRLEQKSAVRRTRKIGNAHLFEPLISRKSVYKRLIDDLLEKLGSAEPLFAHLVESNRLTLDDLKTMEAILTADSVPPAGDER